MNTKDLKPGKYMQVLFIGKSGTRKSTVAASFPGPRYMFDFDRRFNALRGVDVDFDYYPYVKGWGKAEGMFRKFVSESLDGKLKYKTIHVASITTMMRFFLKEALDYYDIADKGGFRVSRKGGADPLLLTDMPHFKFVHQALDVVINEYLMPLSCNVIVEAHEQSCFDKKGNVIGKKMLASDTLAELVPTRFDETWEFVKKRQSGQFKYYIRFRGEIAKTTYRELPDEVEITNKEDVFYDEIFSKLINVDNS